MAVNISNEKATKTFATSDVFGMSNSFNRINETETYNKIVNKFNNIITEINKDKKIGEYKLVKIFKNEAGLNYSCIAVGLINNSKDQVYAHVLVVEKTGEFPSPLFETIQGTRYEIMRLPGDASDEKLVSSCKNKIAEIFNVSKERVVIVDTTLVPNEFNPDNDDMVNNLFYNTINACETEYKINNEPNIINVQNVIENYKNGKFIVNMVFNDSELVKDATGMPVREDICLNLSFKIPSDGYRKSVNDSEKVINLIRVYGYIDFDWVQPVQTPMGITTQKFVPNFVITHIEPVDRLPSPELVLMGIACCNIINEDTNWLRAFRPAALKKNEIDYNDIGALNIEGNIENAPQGYGAKINTKNKEFSILELSTLVMKLVRPGFNLSIDLPQVSPDTWYTSMFTAASQQSSNNGAYARIVRFMDAMTSGAYSSETNNEIIPIFTNSINKIHGGFFETRDGVKDIREVTSYLAVANHIAATNQSPMLLAEYTNTFYNYNIPPELRAANRKSIIESMVSRVVYKQFYNRMTFNKRFLKAVISSLLRCGFAPNISNAFISNDIFQRRNSADISNSFIESDVRLISPGINYPGYNWGYGYNRTY